MSESIWAERFRAFFAADSTRKGLKTLFGAEGCREGWLQGQAYLHFQSKGFDLRTNHLPIKNEAGYQKADFFVPGEDGVVAECKWLGTSGFMPKMLDGLGLKAPQARLETYGELRYDYTVLSNMDEPGEGLLRDFFRLSLCTRAEVLPSTTRLLILVMNRTQNVEPLGDLLLKVQFGDPTDTLKDLLDEDGLLVRAWQIKPQVLNQ